MGQGHQHADRASLAPAPRHLKMFVALLVGPLVLATVVGLAVLWPEGDLEIASPGADVERGTAKVQTIEACPPDLDVDGCQVARVELLSGPGSPGAAGAASAPSSVWRTR